MKPGTAIPEGMKPAGRQVMISCVSGTANIRITAAKNGDTFEWVATAENGWHAVVVNGCVGWVSGKYSKAQ